MTQLIRPALICLTLAMTGGTAIAEGKPNTWELFDYSEERGWSNETAAGDAIALHDCVRRPGTNAVIFRATGFLDKYSHGKAMEFDVTALVAEYEDQVFVAPSEYFGIEFMFEVRLPENLKQASLKFCARLPGATPNDPVCTDFTGPHFAEMIADLCK